MQLAPLVAALALASSAAGCSTKRSQEGKAPVPGAAAEATVAAAPAPAPAPAPVPPPGAAPPPASFDDSIPEGYPPECVAYASLIGRLASCDKIAGARDGLRAAYASIRAGWSATPADRRAEIATQCKTQADSLRNAAAAACGW